MNNNALRNFAKQINLCIAISWCLTTIILYVSKIIFLLSSEFKFAILIMCILTVIENIILSISVKKLELKEKILADCESQSSNNAKPKQIHISKIQRIITMIAALISAPITVYIIIYMSQLK